MPVYTHMQRVQPVSLSHHQLAYCEMFDRDRSRLVEARNRLNVCPLGAGALDGTTYDEIEIELRPGDAFVFVSDGVTEAGGYENEYGAERLAAELERRGHLPAAELSQHLVDEVQSFAGDQVHDDMTLVVVKVLGQR